MQNLSDQCDPIGSRKLSPAGRSTRSLPMLRAGFVLVAVALGALQAYANRDHVFQEDAICYLDKSDAILKGNWHELVDAHWSPLYPLCLAFFRLLFSAGPFWEPAVVKLTNFALFVLVVAAFEFFLTSCLRAWQDQDSTHGQKPPTRLPPTLVVSVFYLWFMWAALCMNGVHHDTPDLLISGIVLAATAIVLRIGAGDRSWVNYGLLGSALGL